MHISPDLKYILTFLGVVRPNEPGQSYMDAKHGVELWQKYIEPLRYQGYQLISPATSSDPNGMVWVKEFVKLCGDGCHVSTSFNNTSSYSRTNVVVSFLSLTVSPSTGMM